MRNINKYLEQTNKGIERLEEEIKELESMRNNYELLGEFFENQDFENAQVVINTLCEQVLNRYNHSNESNKSISRLNLELSDLGKLYNLTKI
jgi:hypothetical protein